MAKQVNAPAIHEDLKLWYRQPASCWKEALPLGNGRIGAMITGDPCNEIIDITEITCFSGEVHQIDDDKGTYPYFYKAREALLQNDYASSESYLQQYIGKRLNYGTHLPMGHLVIRSENACETTKDYIRSLDLNTAVSKVSYRVGEIWHIRTAFLSNHHQIMVMKLEAGESSLNFTLSLGGGNNPHQIFMDGLDIILTGKAFETMHSDGMTGVSFGARVHVVPSGGSVFTEGNSIHISNAEQALVFLAVETDFQGNDPAGQCNKRIQHALSHSFEELLQSHLIEYQALFQRVQLHLGKPEALPTDMLVKRIQNDGDSPTLSSLMFQYGRYLLISASRPDSPLPAQLQGVWNDSVACNIGWTCDMHLDINTQMNYWPAETTNLSECHRPLFRWIENSLVPSGKQTAKLFYGLDGWVAELVSNAWGYTNPYWHTNLSPCPTGGAWVATHLWEHYLFTLDRDFLQQHAYPVFEEAIRFFTGYLFKDPVTGYLTSGPSISPENRFMVDGKPYSASIGPVYEIVIIREIFDIFLKASDVLGLTGELIEKVKASKNALPPFQTGKNGELKEWSHGYDAKDPQHRHTSHLLALFPFGRITPEETPELAEAAGITLEKRMTPSENWEDTGWARSMLMLYAARLKETEIAFRHIQSMQKNLTNPNLMVKHPPTRGAPSFTDVYELDGNTGLTACIAELLVQSHRHEIELLPVLPFQWKNGAVAGLCARGGFTVDMKWKDCELTQVKITAKADSQCQIRYRDKVIGLNAEAGQSYSFDGTLVPETGV